MAPTELDALERRLRRVYERARLRRAFVGFLPVLLLLAAALAFGGRAASVLVLGPVLFAGGVLALWYGREPGRGVLPGVLAGGTALVLVLCANQMGHFCTGERCVSWCLPACVTGGLLAGGLISVLGIRQGRGAGYWASASGITLLTGALGCSCVGFAGMIGLAAGFGAAMLLSLATNGLRRAAK